MNEPLESLARVRELQARALEAKTELERAIGGLTRAEAEQAAALAEGRDPAPTRKSTLRHMEQVAAQEGEARALAEAVRIARAAALEGARVELGTRRAALHRVMDEQADKVDNAVLELSRAHRELLRLRRISDGVGREFFREFPDERANCPADSVRGKAALLLLDDALRLRTVFSTAKRMEQAAGLGVSA